ncbi:hypothetical protein Barb7_03251 [Bacteroidales bacterium Barb7]|nr:hypothetical protein Barb7_03251 [Bacteroidales bacterium Barb7]
MKGGAHRLVVLVAHVKDVQQGEDVVCRVLLVEDGESGLCLELLNVLVEVKEDGFDGLHSGGSFLYFRQEGTCGIAVGFNRGNLRLLYLQLVGVFAFAFVDEGVVVAEIAVGKGGHILLGYLAQAVEAFHFVLPIRPVNERGHEHIRAGFVVFQLRHLRQLVVVEDGFEQVVLKLSLF